MTNKEGRKMRLIYFEQYFYPEKSSGAYLGMDLREAFVNHGWNVDLYVPTPSRGVSDEQREKYKRILLETEFEGKLRIHRLPLPKEGKGFLVRTLRFVLFSLKCLYTGWKEPAEIIFTGSGPPTQGFVGGYLHKKTGKKFVYHLQDIFPDSLLNITNMSEKNPLIKLGRCMERYSYKNADAIITISDDMKRNILDKGADPKKVFVVPNWIDSDKIQPIPSDKNTLFDELGLQRQLFYVTYAGNIGYVQGIPVVIEAAKLLQNNETVQFVIFGNGSEENRVRKMIQDYNLKNVRLFPLQSAERISEVYSLGDVSLVSCLPGTGKAGMPSKTWSIMAAGTPVLGFFDKPSEFSDILDKSHGGWCVPAGHPEELAKVVQELSSMKELCAEYGQNARRYVEEFLSKEKAVSRCIEIIERALR